MKRAIRKFKETVDIRSRWLHRVRSHRYFPVALFFSLFLMACCIHVWQRVQVLGLISEVSNLKRVNAELIDCAKKLDAEIAALTTAGRIERYATDTLGLMSVPVERVVTLLPYDREVPPSGQWADLKKAIDRIAQHLPIVTANRAQAGELRHLHIDSAATGGAD